MEERSEQSGGSEATGAGAAASDSENSDAAGGTVRAFLVPELTLADYAAMARQAQSFADIAHDLRAILRGIHPYNHCDG